jgi:hypothetical protein
MIMLKINYFYISKITLEELLNYYFLVWGFELEHWVVRKV